MKGGLRVSNRLKVLQSLTLEVLHNDSALHWMGAPQLLFPGVMGLTVKRRGTISVVFIMSVEEGRGHVSRYIDHLKQKYSVIRFPNIISKRLENMLVKRGFEHVEEWDTFYGGIADVYVWRKPE